MANKTQAKALVDAAATALKNDIDTILPVGVNIIDGIINFNPTNWQLKLNGETEANAVTVATAIATNLAAAGRPNRTFRTGRRADDSQLKVITVSSVLATYYVVHT